MDYKFIGPERYIHQKVIFWYGMLNKRAAIFADMGSGKTGAAIDISSCRMDYNQVVSTLVVCPTTVMYNWSNEIETFSDKDSVVLYGPLSKRMEMLFDLNPKYFIINYEILRSVYKYIIDRRLGMIILDESTRVKNPNAQVSLATKSIADNMDYRILLSGQPIANDPIDLWMQFNILNNSKTFDYRNFYQYRNHYFNCVRRGRFKKWIINKYRSKELQEVVSNDSIRYLLEECVSLPDKVYRVQQVKMHEEQESLYRRVAEEVLISIGKECGIKNGVITFSPGVAATKMMKLSQVCSGFLYTDKGAFELKHNPKLEALKDIIETVYLNHKVVIWCKYKKSIEIVSSMLNKMGIKYVLFTGEQDSAQKQESADFIQTDKETRVIVGQIRSGIGANFTKATYAIYYENEWSIDAREQSERRIYRIGQENKVVIIDLVIKGSVEEKIIQSFKTKTKIANMIMNIPIRKFLSIGE